MVFERMFASPPFSQVFWGFLRLLHEELSKLQREIAEEGRHQEQLSFTAQTLEAERQWFSSKAPKKEPGGVA